MQNNDDLHELIVSLNRHHLAVACELSRRAPEAARAHLGLRKEHVDMFSRMSWAEAETMARVKTPLFQFRPNVTQQANLMKLLRDLRETPAMEQYRAILGLQE